MSTLDDFFGDGSDGEVIPECSFCGEIEGELIASIQDAYGPTHWHHKACKEYDATTKGTPITPTWDEAMSNEVWNPTPRFERINDGFCPDCDSKLNDNGFCVGCHIVPALDPDFQQWLAAQSITIE